MKSVAIVTDSVSCIPAELVSRYDIRIVPLRIVHDGKTYLDQVDISPTEVYRIMRRREDLPTTSTPSSGDFLNTFRQLSQDAKNILCITLTAQQSNTYSTATVAKEMAREAIPNTPIEVIDSRAVGGSLGFVVIEAARVASEGAGLDQALQAARNMIPRVHFYAMVDTLFYLARTGRIGRASAWAGSLLNIKPIVGHETSVGETTPVERPRTQAKAVKRLVELMADKVGNSPVHVIVHHADELKEGERLKSEIGSRFDCKELYLSEFPPAMGVHAGPGVLAVAFYTDD